MDYLSQSPSYNKLLSCLAEWMALIEMCDDLLERIHLYGIAHYIDLPSVTQKLKANWTLKLNNEDGTLSEKALK